MPIVTFWSNNEKAIGQTVSASIVATVAAIEHNYKVLLLSADFDNKIIETSFGAQESNKDIVKGIIQKTQMNLDSGIQGLLKLADSNRVTPEVIHDYTKIVFKNRLEILYSPKGGENESEEKMIMDKMKNIIINASRYYDYVFVDLKKGIKIIEQENILDISDVVVLNVDQRIDTIEEAFSKKEIQKIYRKIVWNICKSDKNSKYNVKNLTRKLLKREKVNETEYNTLVSEATQEGGLPELMLKFRTIREDDNNYIFVSKIKLLIEDIISKYREMRSGM